MATKKISEVTAVPTPTGADIFPIVQSGVTYKVTRANNASKGADIASAATTDIGAATGEYVEVTGSTTITALGTVAAGTRRLVRFTGALTLTHNAASLILPTAANILTIADDTAEFISLGSGNWLCTRYSRKNGRALAITTGTETITMTAKPIWEAEGAAVASADAPNIWAGLDGNTIHITGTTTITSFVQAPQAGAWMKVIFDGALTLTHGANLNLPGSANITTAANDFAYVYADTTTLFRVLYFRANGNPVTATLASGTYLPTGTIVANLDSVVPSTAQYMRVGSTVTVSGSFTADPTAATETQFRLSLPIASNFASNTQCGGVATGTADNTNPIAIYSVAATDDVMFHWVSIMTSNSTYFYTFTYTII